MPFSSQEEYDEMVKNNPAKAKMFVRHAKAAGKPVINNKNPGYGMSASQRRLKKIAEERKKRQKENEDIINQRKNL